MKDQQMTGGFGGYNMVDVALPLAFVYANNNFSRGTMMSTPMKVLSAPMNMMTPGRYTGKRKSFRGKRRFKNTKRRR